MEKLYDFNAVSHEAREFANNSLKASLHFLRLLNLGLKSGFYLGENFLRLFFIRPRMILKKGPHLFEDVEGMGPPKPSPFTSPPGRMF